MSLVLREEVFEARSSISTRSTLSPRPAASRAIPVPLIPPPTMARSYEAAAGAGIRTVDAGSSDSTAGGSLLSALTFELQARSARLASQLMNLVPEIVALVPEMSEWRHHIHAHPETAFEETATAAFVADKLSSFGIEVHTGLAKTGVVGVLR